MDDGSRLPIIIIAVLFSLAVYFAIAETAFAACSRTRLKVSSDRNEAGAKQALWILDHFDRAISTMLIGTNLCHLFLSALVTMAVTRRWGLSAVTVSTVITALAVFFAAEMLPKSIAKKYPERLARSVSGSLRFFMALFRPFSAVLSTIGASAAKLSRRDPEVSVTEDELYDIIEDMTEEGSLDEEQGELISSALQFGELTVESVLTPRMDIAALDVESSGEEILTEIKAQNHSRLPVYEGSIDHIIGILQIRKYIKEYLRTGTAPELRSLLDEAISVHQSTELSELLPLLSRERINMAVVTDNFGGTLGVVTVEDIVEEIVGEIWDEDDVVEETVTDLSDTACIADADETVSDLFEHLDYEDPEDNPDLVDTRLGEWAYQMFDTIPDVGDSFIYHDLTVTVAEMEHNRILKLKIAKGGESA
ncbi:MAG: HlyC/CorC family transporter [Oscillospiraceae bacterium]|nr:HlyC/CorC family transporter [Oscillospiraceae bacterium]